MEERLKRARLFVEKMYFQERLLDGIESLYNELMAKNNVKMLTTDAKLEKVHDAK